MLRDAALLTLDVQAEAAAAGFTLRDASAFNVLFDGARPVLIDHLSFEPATPGAPWPAYRQFCEHFLAPLALMARRDVRLGSLLRSHLDGIPLNLAARLLPWRSRFSPGLGAHIHLHARSQRRHAGGGETVAGEAGRARVGRLGGEALIESLRRTVTGLDWTRPGPNGRSTRLARLPTARRGPRPRRRTPSSARCSRRRALGRLGPRGERRPAQRDRR
jgi:hypothetical protein